MGSMMFLDSLIALAANILHGAYPDRVYKKIHPNEYSLKFYFINLTKISEVF